MMTCPGVVPAVEVAKLVTLGTPPTKKLPWSQMSRPFPLRNRFVSGFIGSVAPAQADEHATESNSAVEKLYRADRKIDL